MTFSRRLSLCQFLALIGIGLAGYITYLHFGLMRGELLSGPGCSPDGGAFNCHAVTSGAWGQFLGMPWSMWGLLGYVTVFAIALWGRQSAQAAGNAAVLIFTLAALFLALDLYLLFLMVQVIHYYCLLCLITYAVNLGLLVVSANALPMPWPQALGQAAPALGSLLPGPGRPAAPLFWGMMAVSVAGIAGIHLSTTFIQVGMASNARKQIREFMVKQPRVTLAIGGDPSHGAVSAPIQVVEFSDFMCPACQRAARMNTVLFAGRQHEVLFVFKHYPLDMACNSRVRANIHPGACQLAAASECAHLQGKFWPLHDRIFEKGHEYELRNLEADLSQLGVDMAAYKQCMDSGQGVAAVKLDIEEGAKINLQSTPTFVINGIPVGGLTPALFEEFVAVLKEAGS